MAYGQGADKPIPRIPLVVPLESRAGKLGMDAQLINAFAEKDEGEDYDVYKRPGVAQVATIPGMPTGNSYPLGKASVSFSDGNLPNFPASFSFFLNQSTLYSVQEVGSGVLNPSSPVGVYTGISYNNRYFPVSSLPVAYNADYILVFFYPALSLIFFNTSGTLTNTPYPGSSFPGLYVPGIAYLDSTVYVMDINNNIWGSNLGDPRTAWSSSNFIAASVINGFACALSSNQAFVIAFKSSSIEFFFDANNPTGSPLAAVPNSAIPTGCADGYSVQKYSNEIFFLATNNQSSYFFAKIVGTQMQRISTPGVERLLSGFSGQVSSFMIENNGHTFYGMTSFGLNITFVYDVREGVWQIWTDQNGNYWPWAGVGATGTSATTGPSITTLQYTTTNGAANTNLGNVYQVDKSFYTDIGNVVSTDIYTPNYDSGSRYKDTLKRMDFIADQQPGILKIRYNDDDFAPTKWSNFRGVDLNQRRPTLINCGAFRRRCWNIRWQEPYPLRIEAVELDILPGTA